MTARGCCIFSPIAKRARIVGLIYALVLVVVAVAAVLFIPGKAKFYVLLAVMINCLVGGVVLAKCIVGWGIIYCINRGGKGSGNTAPPSTAAGMNVTTGVNGNNPEKSDTHKKVNIEGPNGPPPYDEPPFCNEMV